MVCRQNSVLLGLVLALAVCFPAAVRAAPVRLTIAREGGGPLLFWRLRPAASDGLTTTQCGDASWQPLARAADLRFPPGGTGQPRWIELCARLSGAQLAAIGRRPELLVGRLRGDGLAVHYGPVSLQTVVATGASGPEPTLPEIYRMHPGGDQPGRTASILRMRSYRVPLPYGVGPHELRVELRASDSPRVVLRDLELGTAAAHTLAILRGGVDRFALGVFFCLIGFFTILLSIVRYGERVSILAFNALSFAVGLFTIAVGGFVRLLLPAPELWSAIALHSILVAPIALGVLTEQVLERRSARLVRALWLVHCVHGAAVVGLYWVTGLQHEAAVLTSIAVVFGLSLFVYVPAMLRQAYQGSTGMRFFAAGFGVFVCTVLYDIAGSYYGSVSWNNFLYPYGMLAFIFALGYVLERRFALARRAFRRHAADLEVANQKLGDTNRAYANFVPAEFLRFLGKSKITDVRLGDNVEMHLTLMVTDIHSFTTLSEQMTPEQNFNFVNSYFERLAPVIREHHGFIMKYMGDGFMALFPGSPESAVEAALAMQNVLADYNARRVKLGRDVVRTGIGLHTGTVRLGVIGQAERMQGDVMSDAANLAARMEGLTKMYGARVVFSEQLLMALDDPNAYSYRILDVVQVKGKRESVSVIELLQEYADAEAGLKIMTRTDFERGLLHYQAREFQAASESFQTVLAINPGDRAARLYLERAEFYARYGAPSGWEGVAVLDSK